MWVCGVVKLVLHVCRSVNSATVPCSPGLPVACEQMGLIGLGE